MFFTKKLAVRALLTLACLALLPTACNGTDQEETQETEQTRTPEYGGGGGSQTVTIRPQESFVAQHAEVTISLAFDSKQNLREIEVDPETAIIFFQPDDERLVTQVLWRVECLMDGKLVSCPDEALEAVVIRRKRGCPDLFGTDAFKIPAEHTAIASGWVRKDAYYESMEKYQANVQAMLQKDRSAGDSLYGCNGERLRAAPEKIAEYQGLTWQYNVIVDMGEKGRKELDPEIWVGSDEDA